MNNAIKLLIDTLNEKTKGRIVDVDNYDFGNLGMDFYSVVIDKKVTFYSYYIPSEKKYEIVVKSKGGETSLFYIPDDVMENDFIITEDEKNGTLNLKVAYYQYPPKHQLILYFDKKP